MTDRNWLPDPPPSLGPVNLREWVESLYSDDPDERAAQEEYDRVVSDLLATGRTTIGDATVVYPMVAIEEPT